MSKTRQTSPERLPHLRAAAVGFAGGYRWQSPASRWGQVLSTSRGTMTVEVADRVHVVPSTYALWLPPHTANAVSLSGRGTLRRLYLRGAPATRLPRTVQTLSLTPLLLELVRRAIDSAVLDHRRTRDAHLIDVLVDELLSARRQPVDLPMPRDARAVRAAELVRSDPQGARDAEMVARSAGASVRTLERLFKRETALSFGQWRQRARILASLEVMADGHNVSFAALAVGYATPSAFVAAFKAVVGETPRRFSARVSP